MMNLEKYQHLVCQRDENAKVTTEKNRKVMTVNNW